MVSLLCIPGLSHRLSENEMVVYGSAVLWREKSQVEAGGDLLEGEGVRSPLFLSCGLSLVTPLRLERFTKAL